jgi:hypothetical protein
MKKLLRKITALAVCASMLTSVGASVNAAVGKNKAPIIKEKKPHSISADELTKNQPLESLESGGTRAGNGFHTTIPGTITEGQDLYVTVTLYPGELLHAQLDMPSGFTGDFDLYLYEEVNNSIVLVDWSEYWTYLNSGVTLSEAVGVLNDSDTARVFYVDVVAYEGSGTFNLQVGINDIYDPYETGENARQALSFTFNSNGFTINGLSMDTLCDNDWFKFTTPSYAITLPLSVTTGYTVEVYKNLQGNGKYQMLQIDRINNAYSLLANTVYYVRVCPIPSLAVGSYTLTFGYTCRATINPSGFSGGYGTYGAAGYVTGYDGTSRYRFESSSTLTVTGTVKNSNGTGVANAPVKITIRFPAWGPSYANNANNHYRYGYGTTDANGNFSINVSSPPAPGTMHTYWSGVTMHYYDEAYVKAECTSCGQETSEMKLWHFAYQL